MLSPADHALGDELREYCLYCARPDGELKTYEEALASLAQFVANTQHVSPEEAQAIAASEMSRLPAWTGHP